MRDPGQYIPENRAETGCQQDCHVDVFGGDDVVTNRGMTATPKMNGPTKFARAVISRAICGRMARDEIMVATMLLES